MEPELTRCCLITKATVCSGWQSFRGNLPLLYCQVCLCSVRGCQQQFREEEVTVDQEVVCLVSVHVLLYPEGVLCIQLGIASQV
ncbi:MAG: hypothetical protein D3909_10915 [Candidatus Electrothrix sp. ATG1]|nr:hypothetical protein [Candidatus Electrothrix sp. ATG1]